MTVEEHVRAAEHHIHEAYKLAHRYAKAKMIATQPRTASRIDKMLDDISDYEHLTRIEIGRRRP